MRGGLGDLLPAAVENYPARRSLFLQMVDGCPERASSMRRGFCPNSCSARSMLVVAYNVARLLQWGPTSFATPCSPASARMPLADPPTRPSCICTGCRSDFDLQAPHRRSFPRHPARHQASRPSSASRTPQHGADADRIRPHRHHLLWGYGFSYLGRDGADRLDLHRLHDPGERLADQHPPRHER